MKIKICLVIPSLSHGGAERVISLLANEWAKIDNLELFILLLTKQDIYYDIDSKVKIIQPTKVYNNDKIGKFFYTIWLINFIRKSIKKINPTSILSFCEIYNNLTLLSLKFTNYKVFVSDRNNPNNNLGLFHESLRKFLYKKSSGIIAQTDKAKEILFFKTKHSNIITIPNPIREIEISSQFEKENIILNIGRLVDQKNQIHLIEIFSKVIISKDWKLQIIGTGPLDEEIKLKIKELGIENNVELLGYIDNVDFYLQKSKIFAFTSKFEGFPNALLEAMGNGLACISYDCPTGPAELINNNVNGILIKNFDENEFCNNLIELMNDDSKINELGKNAKYVNEVFSKEQICFKYLNFILDENIN